MVVGKFYRFFCATLYNVSRFYTKSCNVHIFFHFFVIFENALDDSNVHLKKKDVLSETAELRLVPYEPVPPKGQM